MLFQATKVVLIRSKGQSDLVNVWFDLPKVGNEIPTLNIKIEEGLGGHYIKSMGIDNYETINVDCMVEKISA